MHINTLIFILYAAMPTIEAAFYSRRLQLTKLVNVLSPAHALRRILLINFSFFISYSRILIISFA